MESRNLQRLAGFCLFDSACCKWFFEVPWPLFPWFLSYTTEALTQYAHLWNGAVRKIWNVFVGRKTRNCNQNLRITGILWIHSHQLKKKTYSVTSVRLLKFQYTVPRFYLMNFINTSYNCQYQESLSIDDIKVCLNYLRFMPFNVHVVMQPSYISQNHILLNKTTL